MPNLIVNADDLGRMAGVNRGVVEAHKQGIVTSTTVMVNYPDAVGGIEMALEEAPFLGVGLHLTLTSGRPVSSADDIKTINFPESPVKFSGPENVWILARINPGKLLVCHILNRNYDEGEKRVKPVKNVKVILGKPLFDGKKIPDCKLISPDREQEKLDAQIIDGELHISISELGIWSLLVD